MKKTVWLCFLLLAASLLPSLPTLAANVTTSIHVVKYDDNGKAVAETNKSYEWLRDNLPVRGDGVTHYYLQGPVFEGDMWDPSETANLKDKGAVRGTALKDLCGLVGGMSPGEEIMIRAVDGWHTDFAYENIYEPLDIQGVITLCWYNGEDALSGERYGQGYPGAGAYYTAMQVNFLAGTTNAEGQYVFGNSDMKICLPDAKYQHFYEGLPSTNGLSGKWISDVAIFRGEPPTTPTANQEPTDISSGESGLPRVSIIIGTVGLVLVAGSAALLFRRRNR